MTDKRDDGGPAFPHLRQHVRDDIYHSISDGGMSLLDWFAGQALVGILAGQWTVLPSATASQALINHRAAAENAYAAAAAMLAERSKP